MASYDNDAKADRVLIVGASPDGGVTPGTPYDPTAGPTATRVALVTPADGADLTGAPWRYVSFSAAGTLKVTTSGGDTVTIPSGSLAVGMQHLLNVTRIFSTGTTATNIVVYK